VSVVYTSSLHKIAGLGCRGSVRSSVHVMDVGGQNFLGQYFFGPIEENTYYCFVCVCVCVCVSLNG
jgi:hypothetical protein